MSTYRVELMIETGHDIQDASFNIEAIDEDTAHVFGWKVGEQLGFSVSQIVGVLVTPTKTKTTNEVLNELYDIASH